MSKGILAVLAVLVLAVAIAGCGGSGTIKAAANPQTRADVAKAEVIVKQCLTKSHSKASLVNCLAPAGHTAALEVCIKHSLTHDLPLHKSHLTPDVANCVVTNR